MQRTKRIVNGTVISNHPDRRNHEVEDLKGKHFGELIVIDFDHRDSQGRAMWKCLCSCGNTCVVRAYNLKSGSVVSCGHISREKARRHAKKLNYTFGASKEPWYSNYVSMRNRVTNPNSNDVKYYRKGKIEGRLIEQSWLDNPWNFYKEIGSKPGPKYSIDRIDSTKGYVKGNVRWADRETQSLNRNVTLKNKTNNLPVGIKLEPAGLNRRIRNKYLADITVNGRHFRIGNYYSLENAMRARYDAETKFGFKHTFKRPAGDIEIEPDYSSGHGRIFYNEKRHKWRVFLPFGNRKDGYKYVGQYDTLDEAKKAQEKAIIEYKKNPVQYLGNRQRHIKGIIAIDPKGIEHKFSSITDFKRKMHTNANINRRLKTGKPFTRHSSKFYGWRFKYAD